MLNSIPKEREISLEEVKQMDSNQKKLKKESFDIIKNNF
jgi:hypothetical protein